MTFVYHILVFVASRFYAARKIMYALSFVTVLLLLLKPILYLVHCLEILLVLQCMCVLF